MMHVVPEAGVISILKGGTLTMMIATESTARQNLEEDVWEADSKGETCVYLVFDENSRVAASEGRKDWRG